MMELQRLNHELDQFIYHASHDLRSPLTTILGLVNLISLDEPTPLIAKYSELISERVHHLDGLLKDLVSITYNNKTHLQPETINFDVEIRSILKEFHHQFDHVQAFLTIEGQHEFATDSVRFRTIVRNLISNALKYHNPHIDTPFLKILIQNNVDHAVISVADNGIGIEDAHLYKIFGMFFRATEKSKGTGLGLYIVKSMVDKLGGQIQVTSRHEVGTTFSVELPRLLFSDN
jgi:signal transduction histidine kinase